MANRKKAETLPAYVLEAVSASQGVEQEHLVQNTCANCQHWKHLGMDPVLGHCLRSARALQSHIVTTDMQVCSKHEMRTA